MKFAILSIVSILTYVSINTFTFEKKLELVKTDNFHTTETEYTYGAGSIR